MEVKAQSPRYSLLKRGRTSLSRKKKKLAGRTRGIVRHIPGSIPCNIFPGGRIAGHTDGENLITQRSSVRRRVSFPQSNLLSSCARSYPAWECRAIAVKYTIPGSVERLHTVVFAFSGRDTWRSSLSYEEIEVHEAVQGTNATSPLLRSQIGWLLEVGPKHT